MLGDRQAKWLGIFVHRSDSLFGRSGTPHRQRGTAVCLAGIEMQPIALRKHQEAANDEDWGWSMELFVYLQRLSREDPEKFEEERALLLEDFFSRAGKHAPRLRWLQVRVDQMRRRTRNPLKLTVDLSGMMWQSFEELRSRLNEFSDR